VQLAAGGIFASNFFQHIAVNTNIIAAGGKSVKLLDRERKYNVLAWMGAMVQDDMVLDILTILDGTEHKHSSTTN